ncbi:hypothetical protein [Mixta mediterraneensis]|uniref:hypothetical protein n=1 Tax=Mixta mediterraneensis TaxID=2758443 RepID=UPI001875D06C|nr:hypothetical protein [Mixta mediterraneensis]
MHIKYADTKRRQTGDIMIDFFFTLLDSSVYASYILGAAGAAMIIFLAATVKLIAFVIGERRARKALIHKVRAIHENEIHN